MKRILTGLLCAGTITLHAAETSPLTTAKYRWGMVGGHGLKTSGAVKTGVALKDAEREASLARGGDGLVAEFAGGWLALADAGGRKIFFLVNDSNPAAPDELFGTP